MPKPKTRHLTSSDPVIFTIQVMAFAAVVFAVAFFVFAFTFTPKIAYEPGHDQDVRTMPAVDSPDDISNDVDEAMFTSELNGEVDEEKINTLFPQIK